MGSMLLPWAKTAINWIYSVMLVVLFASCLIVFVWLINTLWRWH